MSSAAVTPNNNMNGNKSLSPLEAVAAAAVAAGGSNATGNAANSPQGHQQLPQQALQNLQRILQSQLANVNPIHLQQALQRHQQQQMVDAGRKQLEQMLQQLQVRNAYHILISLCKKGSVPIQTLPSGIMSFGPILTIETCEKLRLFPLCSFLNIHTNVKEILS